MLEIDKRQFIDSAFFAIAEKLLLEGLPRLESFTEHRLTTPAYPKFGLVGLTATVYREYEFGPESTICSNSAAEAEITSGIGGFVPDTRTGQLKFALPRQHLGYGARIDQEVAVWNLFHSPRLNAISRRVGTQNCGIIYFAREGHLTNVQDVLALLGVEVPATFANIGHAPASNRFGRVAKLHNSLNLEAFPPHLENLFLCDPVASGMQHVALLEELVRIGRRPENLVVIAPIATHFGISVIEQFCRTAGIRFSAGTCAALLDILPPDYYFSPYPASSTQVADPRMHALAKGSLGEMVNRVCIRGNWTMSFIGTHKSHAEFSDEELERAGVTPADLEAARLRLTVQVARDAGLFDRLVPHSTIDWLGRHGLG